MTLNPTTVKPSIRLHTLLLAAVFLFGLFSATTFQIFTNPHSAYASSDTYPAPWAPPAAQDSILDTWKEWNRECTSYAAWMLHSVNGFEMPFNDDASGWGTDASNKGYTVNMTPAVGSIFWSTSSDHVAWVESVSSDGTTITTEDYNSGYPTNPGWWAEHPGVATSSASGYIHFKDISNPLRIGTVTNNGTFLVKETTLDGSWHTEAYGASQGIVSGSLVGDVAGGTFQVKKGNLDGSWTTEEQGDAVTGSLSDVSGSKPMRIGVLTSGGHFLVKESGLSTPWTDEYSGVVAGYVSGTRIGVLTSSGSFLVKDGSLSAPWVDVYDGVSQGILSGTLAGVVTTSGTFLVKQSSLSNPWTTEGYNVSAGMLSDQTSSTSLRIGMQDTSGTFSVKEGSLSAEWNTEYYNVRQGVVSGGLISALDASGNFFVKQGTLTNPWNTEYYGSIAGVLWSL